MPAYTDKIDRVFQFAAQLGFTERDYARMAVAAADQAMTQVHDQDEIAKRVGLYHRDPFNEEK